jgi:SAM-dependent methyltransferase
MLSSPAAERNKDAILDVLTRVLPEQGTVLEIASGTGQHVVHFARALSHLYWQPSDPDPAMCESIAAHLARQRLNNVAAPLRLDVIEFESDLDGVAAMLCINMVHISPWAATAGLFAAGTRLLRPGAPLIVYGPYKRGGAHTAPSNAAFDASLKARDPAWGVRDLDAVVQVASDAGFELEEIVSMPANNLTVVFRRS